MKLGSFALRNSTSINTLRIALAFLGLYILFTLPREQYPNVPLYYVHILVPYSGATALEVEKDITQKVETQIQNIEDVNNVVSIVSDGLNFTRLSFSQSLSEQEFQNRYNQVQSLMSNLELPKNALKPSVEDFTYLDFLSIVNVIVYSDGPLDGLIEDASAVESALQNVKGVLNVYNKGLFDRRIVVQLDEAQIQARGITNKEISDAIQQKNVSIPGGFLRTKTQELNIRTIGNITNTKDIANIIIRSNNDINGGAFTKLGDIAKVYYSYDTNSQKVRFNGKRAVEFQIYKTGAADSITLVNDVKKQLEIFTTRFESENKDTSLQVFADTTENIKNTISILTSNTLIGFTFLFLSLLIFLGWRSAVISAIEIPFTFATSFFVLKLLGITLNSSTLFALVLVLGMLVDNSIVILENIVRLRHFCNKTRKEAAVEGLKDVAFPVITSTLTTVGTFFPLIFMPGFIGKFLLPVPVTIIVTLIISLISALIIIPIYYVKLPGHARTSEIRIFESGRDLLGRAVEGILRWKTLVCLLTGVVVVGAIIILFYIPVSLYDTEDQPFFFVDVTMPAGTSIERSDVILAKMEKEVLPLQKTGVITGLLALVANTDPDLAEGIKIDKAHNAQLQIEVPNPYSNKNVSSIDEIMENVRVRITPIAGPDSVRIRKQRTGPPVVPAIGYQLLGDDLALLSNIDKTIRTKLTEYTELYNIRSNFASQTPSLLVTIDAEKAARYKVNTGYVGSTIRAFFAEDAISSVFVNNEQTDIVVRLGEVGDFTKQKLAFLTFPTADGTVVPFSSFATVNETQELTSIFRENGERKVNITAESFSRDRVRQINADITAEVSDNFNLMDNKISFSIGGEFDEFSDLLKDILLLLIISIALVYVILTTQFKSYFQPFLIMLTILFSTIGVSVYLVTSRTPLSISVLYSFVALVGVVVNNAIVLISTANSELHDNEHTTHHRAIIIAVKKRFKPVVLTSFTTIVGVLPTALGISGKSPIWQPMATTIAVGLFFSTITTMFILPAFYELFSSDHKKKRDNKDYVIHDIKDKSKIKNTYDKKRKKRNNKYIEKMFVKTQTKSIPIMNKDEYLDYKNEVADVTDTLLEIIQKTDKGENIND